MSFIQPHIILGDFMHCPVNRVANRVKPLACDSHRYDCPSCGQAFKLKEQPIARELEPVKRQEARLA